MCSMRSGAAKRRAWHAAPIGADLGGMVATDWNELGQKVKRVGLQDRWSVATVLVRGFLLWLNQPSNDGKSHGCS
jgi:hypothetical protein